jgi:hypothetical protein
MTPEQQTNRREAIRLAAENRFLIRAQKLEAKAAPMIGELCRNGSEVFYTYPSGGRYFESNSHTAVVDYLIRNKYVA